VVRELADILVFYSIDFMIIIVWKEQITCNK